MVPVAIYGDGKWSKVLQDILENEYSHLVEEAGGEALQCKAFVSLQKTENAITIAEFAKEFAKGTLAAIILPKEYYIHQNAIVMALLREGVPYEGIYVSCRLEGIKDISYNALLTPFLEDPYLSYLEYHVADHCNLNCKLCTHYSPLVMEPVFTDLDTFKKGLKSLKQRVKDIGIIRILGGEPLLNDQLPAFIEYTRFLYPAAIIDVVTNGILVEKISDELIKTMQDNIVFFHISLYKPVENQIEKIKRFLVEKNIAFTVSPMNDVFMKTQKLEESQNTDFFFHCFQATCTCLQDGILMPCYAPYTTKYFNRAFGEALPTEEGLCLTNPGVSLEEIKRYIYTPMERCKYCYSGAAESWQAVGKKSCKEDWV